MVHLRPSIFHINLRPMKFTNQNNSKKGCHHVGMISTIHFDDFIAVIYVMGCARVVQLAKRSYDHHVQNNDHMTRGPEFALWTVQIDFQSKQHRHQDGWSASPSCNLQYNRPTSKYIKQVCLSFPLSNWN